MVLRLIPGLVLTATVLVGCTSSPSGLVRTPAEGTFTLQASIPDCSASGDCGPSSWDLLDIGIDPASRPPAGAKPVVVATIDTGVDPDHPALAGGLEPLIDIVGPDTFASPTAWQTYLGRDGNGHGTHVAGTILAVAGTESTRVLPIKAIGNTGVGADSSIAKAIRLAVDWTDPQDPTMRVKAINLSIGGKTESALLADAIHYAYGRGVVVVASAGNQGTGVDYPGAMPEVIAVSATNAHDEIADYSNRGSQVAIAAPGGDGGAGIVSTWPTYLTAEDLRRAVSTPHPTATLVGTSMAAPHVTGAIALLLSQNPNLTPSQIRDRLAGTAVDLGPVGPDPYFGAGLLAIDRALAARGPDATP